MQIPNINLNVKSQTAHSVRDIHKPSDVLTKTAGIGEHLQSETDANESPQKTMAQPPEVSVYLKEYASDVAIQVPRDKSNTDRDSVEIHDMRESARKQSTTYNNSSTINNIEKGYDSLVVESRTLNAPMSDNNNKKDEASQININVPQPCQTLTPGKGTRSRRNKLN